MKGLLILAIALCSSSAWTFSRMLWEILSDFDGGGDRPFGLVMVLVFLIACCIGGALYFAGEIK